MRTESALNNRPTRPIMSNLTPIQPTTADDTNGHRMERFQTMEPGTYWRAKADTEVNSSTWKNHDNLVKAGTVLLLAAVDVYDAAAHTIVLAEHPSIGEGSIRMLVHDFLNAFEYAPDGEAVREREIAAIHARVAEIQHELQEGQRNPAIMAQAITSGLSKWEAEKQDELTREARNTGDHAPSTALVLSGVGGTMRTDIDFVLQNRLTTQDVVAMRLLAEREAVRAELTAKWMTTRTNEIASVLQSLAPFFAEKAQVALARTSSVRQYASELMKGIASLDLYTGKGVVIERIATGESAPREEKLHLRQAKLYADGELAAWADVDEDWDFYSLPAFDKALSTNAAFRDQILPKPRTVVAMATRRDRARYDGMNAFEAARRELRNKTTFLLIRDGENIYRVYSGEPTHEGTPRLFPTRAEIDQVFTGFDGSDLTFRDLEFTSAVADHERLALHYKRFLILLCGLDHRERLFGDFYDPAEALQFLTLGFQQRHFVFIADDEPETLIGTHRPDVQTFIKHQNSMLRSGSRVLCYFDDLLDEETAPSCLKRDRDFVNRYAKPVADSAELIAYKDGNELCVDVLVARTSYRSEGAQFSARVSLTKARPASGGQTGVLCLDGVSSETLEWYVHNRHARIHHIAYIRLFKRAAARLRAEELAEQPARDYLRNAICDAGIVPTGLIDDTLNASIIAWRCAQRGKSLPDLSQKQALGTILDQVWAQQGSDDLLQRTHRWIEATGIQPLRVTLTGKNRLAVYAVVPEAERDTTIADWGWVRRFSVTPRKTALQCTSERFEWMTDKPNPAETVLQDWPAVLDWLQKKPEQFKPRHLVEARAAVETAVSVYRENFRSPGAGLDPEFLRWALSQIYAFQRNGRHSMVGDCFLSIPFAAYVQPRSNDAEAIRLIAMHAPFVHWLYHFANDTQREEIVTSFVRRYASKDAQAEFARQPISPNLTCLAVEGEGLRLSDNGYGSDTLTSSVSTSQWPGTPFPLSTIVRSLAAGGSDAYRKRAGRAARVHFASALSGLSDVELDNFFPVRTTEATATLA